MEVVLRGVEDGKRMFGVLRHGQEVFAGTRDECRRYLAILQRKMLDERLQDRRPLRAGPYCVRTYHVAAPRAG